MAVTPISPNCSLANVIFLKGYVTGFVLIFLYPSSYSVILDKNIFINQIHYRNYLRSCLKPLFCLHLLQSVTAKQLIVFNHWLKPFLNTIFKRFDYFFLGIEQIHQRRMLFDNIIPPPSKAFPVNTNHNVSDLDLPSDRLRLRQGASLAIIVPFALENFAF